jgi:EF hand
MATLCAVSTCGCSGQRGAVGGVAVDPGEASRSLIAERDKDGDGSLSSDELDGLAAISGRMDKFDHDHDGKISQLELQENLARVFDGRTGLLSATCQVTRNGRPLSGAYVYFVPIPLIEKVIPVASGVTDAGGVAKLSIQKEDLPKNAPSVSGLIRPGLYFIEIKHPTVNVPEQYNSKTTLGQEISPETCAGGPIRLALKF